jgi:PEP-CTERM motif
MQLADGVPNPVRLREFTRDSESPGQGERMKRIIFGLGLVAISASSWGQATIELDSPSGTTFAPNQVITLDLVGNNWTVPLDGGGVDLSFNPSVLSLQSVTVNTDVFDYGLYAPLEPTIDNAAGSATGIDFFTLLNNDPTGNFDVATVTFLTQGAGSANLSLGENVIGFSSTDSNFNVSSLAAGRDFIFQTAGVSVTSMVAAVPEPSTFWLLAAASLAALSMRRRILKRMDFQ